MQPGFHISHRDEKDWTVVEIHGDVDVNTVPRIRDYVTDRIQAGRHRLVVDLSGVTFMDSMGLGILVAVRNRIGACVGDLRLVIVNPDLLRIFHMTYLHRAFAIHDSVRAALTE